MITIGYGDTMNKVYDFSWIVADIDQCMVLKLVQNDKLVGIYQVSNIGYDLDNVLVKFANIADLIKFVNHSGIVFSDVSDSSNIIRVPIRKLLLLFSNSNKLEDVNEKGINADELEAFIMHNGELLKGQYQIKSYKITEESDELKEIMDVAYKFGNLGMNDKIDALEKVNLANYHKTNGIRSA